MAILTKAELEEALRNCNYQRKRLEVKVEELQGHITELEEDAKETIPIATHDRRVEQLQSDLNSRQMEYKVLVGKYNNLAEIFNSIQVTYAREGRYE